MSPPLPPMQTGRQVGLFDCLGCVSVLTGALAGVTWGGMKYGWLGALIGLPAGMVLGPIALVAFWVACFVTIIPSVILFTEGPRGVWEFVRGRWVPPAERPPGAGTQ